MFGNKYTLTGTSPIDYSTTIQSKDLCFSVPEQVHRLYYMLSSHNTVLTINVSWSKPSSDVPITKYEILWQEDEDSNTTKESLQKEYVLQLMKGTMHIHIAVRAVSVIGYGCWSESLQLQGTVLINHQL